MQKRQRRADNRIRAPASQPVCSGGNAPCSGAAVSMKSASAILESSTDCPGRADPASDTR